MSGEYKIQANFYRSRQQELTGACTVETITITNFGPPNETRKTISLRLTNQKDIVYVGTASLK